MVPASTSKSTIAEACCGQPALDLLDDLIERRRHVGGQVRGRELRVQPVEADVEVLRQVDQERDQRESDEKEPAAHDQDRGAERPARGLRATPAARSQSLVEGSERRRRDQGEQDRERDDREVHRQRDDEGAEGDRDQDAPADGGQAGQPAGYLPCRSGRRRLVGGCVKRHPQASDACEVRHRSRLHSPCRQDSGEPWAPIRRSARDSRTGGLSPMRRPRWRRRASIPRRRR